MAKWQLHIPEKGNSILRYHCGLVAGQHVRLKKDLVVRDHRGKPTGEVYPAGEEWEVLAGISSDPVLWFRQANGDRQTWDDDAAAVDEWFERIP